MLSKLTVGRKILLLVVPLLLIPAVIVALGIIERSRDADDAKETRDAIAIFDAADAVGRAIEIEAIAQTAERTGANFDIEAQTEATDRAISAFEQSTEDARGLTDGLDETFAALHEELAEIGAVRDQVADQPGDAAIAYIDLSNEISHAADRAARTVGNGAGTASLAGAADIVELRANDALLSALLLANETAELDDEKNARASTAAAAYRSLFAEVADHAVAGRSAADALSADRRQWTEFNQDRSAVLNIEGEAGKALDESMTTVFAAQATQRVEDLSIFSDQLIATSDESARSDVNDASRRNRWYLGGALLALALAGLLASAIWRSIVRPLRRVTDAANNLATVGLPALIERLRNPDAGSDSVELAQVPVKSSDEIGELTEAFNEIQSVTQTVGDGQAAVLRSGISGIFVNLARRNQTLLDRQIDFIDELERNEDDPEQLENLFRLDHLATRMRRNAESLLVLAGEEPSRRRGRPVPIDDVVRVAAGEVEDYSRIKIRQLEAVDVASNVAVDIAHLLSELMENAANFSPPSQDVVVNGATESGGELVLTVRDYGIGMGDDELAEANELLSSPPPIGLEMSRALGFTVVARLAARWGIDVSLGRPDADDVGGTEGTMATVVVPIDVLEGRTEPVGTPAEATESTEGDIDEAPVDEAPADEIEVDDVGRDADAERVETETDASDPEVDAAPDSIVLDTELGRSELDQPGDETVEGSDVVDEAEIEPVATGRAESESDSETEEASPLDGELERRSPKSGKSRSLDPETERLTASNKSPEEIRKQLDDYHTGLEKGRDAGDAADQLVEAVPQGDDFEEGLAQIVADDEDAGSIDDIASEPGLTAPTGSEPLQRRTPKKRGQKPRTEAPLRASTRSPEEVRSMLDQYKGGLKRGRVETDEQEEETD